MRHVFTVGLALLRRPGPWIACLAIASGGLLLLAVPLFGVPGFELALGVSLLAGTFGGLTGVCAADLLKLPPRPRAPTAKAPGPGCAATVAVAAASLLNAAACAVPFAVSSAVTALTSRCSPFAEAGFYPLLTLPSAFLAAAAGVLCRSLFARRTGTAVLYCALLLGSAVWTIWPLVFGPQVFAFNFFGGYWPGPLYDEALEIPPGLLWFRVETLALVCLFTGLAAASFPAPGPAHPTFRRRTILAVIAAGLAIVLCEANAARLGFRVDAGFVQARLGGRAETPHAEIWYPRSKPGQEVERLRRDVEFRWTQISAFLGGAPAVPLHVYVFPSPEEKRRLVGAAGTQFSKPWQLAVFLNDAPFPHPALKHELAHAMAAPFGSGPFQVTARWKFLPMIGVVEGMAVAADDPVGELTLHEWAAGMRRQKLAPDVRQLLGPAGFYGAPPARAYAMVGSFLRSLRETEGREKFQRLLAHGEVARVYGRPVDALATEWERMLDALPLDERAVNRAFARFREPSLFERPCAREVAALEAKASSLAAADPFAALSKVRRCAALQPEEPGFPLLESRLLLRLDRRVEAAGVLARLGARVAGRPTLESQVALAQAELAWDAGLPQDAGAKLEQVLAWKPGLDLEREAEVKRAALSDPVAGPAIWGFFAADRPESLRLLALSQAVSDRPAEQSVAHYLLGRRLLALDAPAAAAAHLGKALAGSLPEAVLREAWGLRISADYRAGDCNGVQAEIGKMPDFGTAQHATASEWQARCGFEQKAFQGPLVPRDAFR